METKNPNPNKYLNYKNTSKITRQYYQVNHLKNLYRQGWLHRNIPKDKCESVAEHTFGVAILAMLIAEKHFPFLDLTKVLKLSLLHDLGEIYAGDITPKDNISPEKKKNAELASFIKVFGEGGEATALWKEYEAQLSPEAILVNQIDRLEMALQASIYEHQGYKSLQEFFDTTKSTLVDQVMIQLFEDINNARPQPGN